MEGSEKRQWTVRGVSADTIRQVKILSAHYGLTNGELLNQLVGVAYAKVQDAKKTSIQKPFSDLDITHGIVKLEETDGK